MDDRLLTIQEAAKLLRVSITTLRRYDKSAVLKSQRTPGNQRRYSLKQVNEFIYGSATPVIASPNEERAKQSQTDYSEIASSSSTPLNDNENEFLKQFSSDMKKMLKQVQYAIQLVYPKISKDYQSISNLAKNIELTSAQQRILTGFTILLFSTSLIGTLTRAGVLEYNSAVIPNLFRDPLKAKSEIPKQVQDDNTELASKGDPFERNSKVLAATDIPSKITFKVNVPSLLTDTLTVEGETTFKSNISTDNKDINLGGGKLTAGSITAANVLYSLSASTGISLSSGQSPKITNTGVTSLGDKTGDLKLEAGTGITVDGLKITNSDTGSSMKIFKTVTVGSTSFSAGSSTDTLTFAGGTGITVTPDTSNKKLTITASGSDLNVSGFTDGGTTVYLSTTTDNLALGRTSTDFKLDVAGSATISATLSLAPSIQSDAGTCSASTAGRFYYDGPMTQYYYCNGSSWTQLGSTSGGINWWTQSNGAIYQINSTVDLLIGGTSSSSAKFAFINVNSGTPTASVAGDLTLDSTGNIQTTKNQTLTIGGNTTGNIILSPSNGASASFVAPSTNNAVDLGSSALMWRNLYLNGNLISGPSGTVGFWQIGSGSLFTTQTTADLLIGSNATSSSKFAVLNLNSTGTPTASISAQNASGQAVVIAGDSTIQSTRNNTLTIGGSTTGNITLSPLDGSGIVLNTGTMNLSSGKTYQIAGTDVLSATTLGTAVVSSSLTSVGTITTGVWNASVISPTYGGGVFDITSGSLTQRNTTLDLLVGATSTASANFHVYGSAQSGTQPAASVSANTSFAAFQVDNRGVGPLFTASSSGVPQFVIRNNGNVGIGNVPLPTAMLDVAGTASVSSTLNFRSGSGTIQTTAMNTLTIGGTTTGTINIGSDATARNMTIGNSTGATALNFTSGTGAQTFASSNATATTTSGAWAFTGNSLTSGTGMYLSSSSITQGKLAQLSTGSSNTLTTGTLLDLRSTATSLTGTAGTGTFVNIDWSPGSSTTATGDLFALNIGSNGTTTGNLFNILDSGSSIFAISETAVTTSLPISETAPGDVSIAYDISMTNPTASYIKSQAPLYLQAGEVFNSSDLTLATYQKGSVIVSSESFVVNKAATISAQMVIGGNGAVVPANIGTLYVTGGVNEAGKVLGKALAIFNQTESTDIFTASASGTTRLVLTNAGNLGIQTGVPTAALDVAGAASVSSTLNFRTGSGTIQTTTMSTLTLGGSTTGDILLNPSNALAGGVVRPNTTNVTDLGTSSVQFRNFYGQNIYLNGQPLAADWDITSGALTQKNTTLDLLLGGTATNSSTTNYAKFGILNVNSGTPTASVSAGTAGASYLTATGTLQTTANQTLTLGGSTTGNIILNPLNGTGRVGINTASPLYALDVTDTQASTMSAMITNSNAGANAKVLGLKIGVATPGTGNYFLSFLGGNGDILGKIRGNGTTTSVTYDTAGGDFAEYFKKSVKLVDEFGPGDLICLSDDGGAVKCSDKEQRILGAFSDQAGFVGAGGHENDPNYVLVGLLGQLRIKVSTESGLIKKGDFLTSSSTPGVAMKATRPGFVIGKALEEFDEQTPGVKGGKILVFVQPSYADPFSFFDGLTFDSTGNLIVKGITTENISLVDSIATVFNPAINSSSSEALAESRSVFSINSNNTIDQRLASLESKVASLSSVILANEVRPESSASAFLDSGVVASLLPRMTSEETATLSGTLTVLGRTLLSDVGVTGTITNGLLSIDGLNAEITSLAKPLTLNTLTIDSYGNLITKGTLTTTKIQIDTSNILSASAGVATISAGQTFTQVKTTAITANSLIFATADTTPVPLSTKKINTNTFEIRINQILPDKLKVNWWIIN